MMGACFIFLYLDWLLPFHLTVRLRIFCPLALMHCCLGGWILISDVKSLFLKARCIVPSGFVI